MSGQTHNQEAELVFRIIAWVFKATVFMVKRLAVSLGWLVALAFAANSGSGALAITLGIFALGTIVGGFWYRGLWKAAPVVADVLRGHEVFKARRAKIRGNAFLSQMKLVSEEEAQTLAFEAFLTETPDLVELELARPIRGLSNAEIVKRVEAFADQLNARRVSHEDRGDGALAIKMWKHDPLDEPFVLEEPASLDPASMTIACAINEIGEPANLSFKGNAGMLVAGMPGSGKTAGVTSFLLPLALSDDVALSVIDCKGGADWENYSEVADEYLSDSDTLEGLTEIRDLIARLKDEMVERINDQKADLGNSNFWNNALEARRAHGYRFRLLVVDECQELFISTTDKEKKALLAEIGTMLTSITKRGRSAGICIIYITQKPTADSIPTGIRDNCALRIAFRLSTTQAEEAVLGATGDIARPSATEIPANRPGGAIIATDSGAYEAVRFGFMPEEAQEKLLDAHTQSGGVEAGTNLALET